MHLQSDQLRSQSISPDCAYIALIPPESSSPDLPVNAANFQYQKTHFMGQTQWEVLAHVVDGKQGHCRTLIGQ